MIKVRKEREGFIVSLYQIEKVNTIFTEKIQEQLELLVKKTGAKIYFDLSKIRFIDSSGFEMLKHIHEIADHHGSDFILCNSTAEVEELLSLLDLQNYFKTCKKSLKREMIEVEVE